MTLFGGSRRRRHRKSGMRKRGGEDIAPMPNIDLSKTYGLTGGSRRRRRRGRKTYKK